MRKEPVHYSGIEIDTNVINRFKLIAKSRYESYIELYNQLKVIKEWEK